MQDLTLSDAAIAAGTIATGQVPTHIVHHQRGRRIGLADRLQAAFGAFIAPERLQAAQLPPPANDDGATSLTDPLALPPDWHAPGDLLSLSFLPFER